MLIPALLIAWQLFRDNWRRANSGFLPAFAPFWLLLVVAVPGFYLPPFYDGIAGWTLHVDLTAGTVVGGFQLVRRDRKGVWYSSAFDNPVTQDGRLQLAIMRNPIRQSSDLPVFDAQLSAYLSIFAGRRSAKPKISRSVRLSAAYSCDLRSIYKQFPPDSIVLIRRMSIKIDPDGKAVGTKIFQSYDVKSDRVVQ